jgi:hypothetical protein
MSDNNLDAILGYGKKVQVMIPGEEKDGVVQEKTLELHFTPVSLKDMPELQKLLAEFMGSAETNEWNKEAIHSSARIIQLSLKKMHPKITEEEISDMFTLGGLARAVRIVMDVNDFLKEMGEMKEMTTIATMAKKK